MANHKYKKPRQRRAGCWCKFEKKLASNRPQRLKFRDRRRKQG